MNRLAATTALVIAGSAHFASAQTTLVEILDLAEAGAKVEGAEITFSDRVVGSDGSVEYTDLSIVDPEDGTTIETAFLKAVPSADDPSTITFTVGDVVSISGEENGEPFSFTITSDDLVVVTNAILAEVNDIQDITVEFSADTLLLEGGDENSAVLRDLLAEIDGIDFSMLISMADMFAEGSLTVGQTDMKYDLTMDAQTQDVNQSTESMGLTFSFDIPEDDADAIGYLDGTKNGSMEFESGKTTFESMMSQDGLEFAYNGSTEGGRGEISVQDGVMTYDIQNGAIDITVIPGGGAPFPPVEINMAELIFKIILPLNSAEDAEQAIVDILFADLEVGEGLWAMIDPGQTIPRDPANLAIDMDAMVQIDALTAAMTGVDNPFEAAIIDNLNINKILVSFGGALLESDGAMTFDNTGPFPMPMGALNVSLAGAQGLADKLVALGLVDQMSVGMVMGMMMAFAKPDGDDKFVSEITFSEEGIFANGQPLQ